MYDKGTFFGKCGQESTGIVTTNTKNLDSNEYGWMCTDVGVMYGAKVTCVSQEAKSYWDQHQELLYICMHT